MKMTKILNNLFLLVAIFALAGNTFAQTCPSGLIGYWKMDETSGNTLVDAIAGANANRNTSTGSISGVVGTSQRFSYSVNGGNNGYTDYEYATVPNSSAFNFSANSSFTIAYWVRFRDCGYGFQDHIAISKGDWGNGGGPQEGMFASGLNGSCRINFLLRDNTGYKIDLEGPTYYNTETWYFVTCVRDEASEKNILYVNGSVTDQATYNYSGAFTSDESLEFGDLVNTNRNYFLRGDLDEVAIFNKALSSSEINELMNKGLSGDGICTGAATAPTITSSPVTTVKVNESYSYDVNATGSATITYSLSTFPAGMTINSSTGVISWTPSAGGSYNVTVVADNGVDPDATQSFSVTVSGDSPVITSAALTSGNVGEAYSYDVNATGSGTITYSLTTFPAGMTINSSTGLISWNPSVGGSFNVTVQAENGFNPAATQSYVLNITGSNPTIVSTPVTTGTMEELYTYDVNATGTQLGMTYSLETAPAGMNINASTGVITWTPASSGDFSVSVKADNGIDPDAIQNFTITVANINPDITSTAVTSAFVGSTYTYDVNAAGKQSTMAYSLSVKPTGMTINSTTGVISWTPSAAGNFNVRVKADNGIEPADSQSFIINVIEASLCPDGIISLHKLDEASGSTYYDYYEDHDATASSSPTATSGIIGGAQLFGASTKIDIPDAGTEYDWLSTESFSFECWIKTSTTAEMVVLGRVRTDYNNAARWLIGTTSTGKAKFELRDNGGPNSVISGTKTITDNQWHHIVAVRNGNSNTNLLYVDGSLEASVSKSYVYSFKADNALVLSLGYLKVSSGDEFHYQGTLDEVTIFNRALSTSEISTFYNGGSPTGHCKGSNNPPYFSSSPVTSATEDVAYSYTATVNDADASDVLSISVQSKPAWLNFNYSAGSKSAIVSGTPNNNNVGDNNVVLRVSDGDLTRDQIFRIEVANVNDAPVKTSTPVTTINEGVAYSYSIVVTDVDEADLITMTAITKPSWLTFTHTAGAKTATLSGTPTNVNVGNHSVSISITDGHVTIYDNFTIAVNNVNSAPVITSQSTLVVNEDQSLSITKDNLTITDDNPATDLSISVQSGTNYTFTGNTITPVANFNGQLSVNVIASDGQLNSAVYPVIVTVNPVNDSPEITSTPGVTVEEGTNYSYTITVADVDAGDAITISATKPDWLTFSWTAGSKTASISGIAPHTAIGATNSVSLSVTDGHATVNQSFNIAVTLQNNAPVITGQRTLSVNEDASITIQKSDLTITDSDNNQSDITITVQAGNNYTFSGNVITPVANFNGQLNVNVVARDLSENSAVYPVIVTVIPVDDVPVINSTPNLHAGVNVLYNYIFEAVDPDNTELTKSAITLPSWLSFSSSTGALTGIPVESDLGEHLVVLQVSDGTNIQNQIFTITVVEKVGISENTNNDFIIYPIPAKSELTVKFNYLSENAVIDIISSTGSIVKTIQVEMNTESATIEIDDLKPGIYICQIRNNHINASQRFIINK